MLVFQKLVFQFDALYVMQPQLYNFQIGSDFSLLLCSTVTFANWGFSYFIWV